MTWDLEEIIEGRARLLVPPTSNVRGPKKRGRHPFYNPAMVLSRDLSVLGARVLLSPSSKFLDGLSGTGARGIRVALDRADLEVVANDWNPSCRRIIEINAARNGVLLRIKQSPLDRLLLEERFDSIDIDPFGSPAPFLPSALGALRKGGVLSVTATDTAALSGSCPPVGLRRYQALTFHGPEGRILGARILSSFVIRMGAMRDLGVELLLAFVHDHYARAFFQVQRGAQRADKALENVGYYFRCRGCPERGFVSLPPSVCPSCGSSVCRAGPLYTKPLASPPFVRRIEEEARLSPDSLGRPKEVERFLSTVRAESETGGVFYDVPSECSRLRLPSVPSFEEISRGFKERGLSISRTHSSPTAFVTPAPAREVESILRSLRKT